jgi:pimeloyl-ACP methyl ester carboxylesterase
VPGAELLRIEGAGHLSNLEAPDSFDAALDGVLITLDV